MMKTPGLAILFHSGSYDRVHYGLGVALAACALGREVKLLFSEGALSCIRGTKTIEGSRKGECVGQSQSTSEELAAGDTRPIREYLTQLKEMGAEIHACSASMSLLGLDLGDLPDQVNGIVGLATFLCDAEGSQLLFV